MKAHWKNLNSREKAVVTAGLVLVLSLLFYMLLVKPLNDEYARLRTEVPSKRNDLQWMISVANENWNNASGSVKKVSSRSFLNLMDQSARQFKISENLVKVEAVGKSGAKLRFEDVFYIDFVKWLRSLVNSRKLSISSMVVERADNEGYVYVRLSLEQK